MNLDLGSTIWLDVSRKLLACYKHFFTPFDLKPEHVQELFRHHSHTHPQAVVTSSSVSHSHGDYQTSSQICGSPNLSKSHVHLDEYDNPANAHTHSFTVTFAAANLGSPWSNHVHALGGSVANGGAIHSHTCQGNTGDASCSYGSTCRYNPHSHSDTLSLSNGGGAHNNHTISGNSATAVGTAEAHTHTFSFNSGYGNEHTHAYSGSAAIGPCYIGSNHAHNYTGISGSSTHRHSVSGISGSGGESGPTVAVGLAQII